MRFAVSAIALLACTSLASAADLGGPSYGGSLKDDHAAPAAHSWTGLYIGAHGGWAGGDGWSGDFFWKNTPQNYGYSLDAEGWYGGIQAGANHQLGSIVLGLEADVSWGDLSDSGIFQANNAGASSYAEWEINQELERFGTVRVRLGYLPSNNLLVYGTGGLAWGQTSTEYAVHYPKATPPQVRTTGGADENHIGWTIGGGFEWAFTDRLSLKGEYLYLDLGKEDYHFVGERTADHTYYADDSAPSTLDFHTVRVGVNYKFGG